MADTPGSQEGSQRVFRPAIGPAGSLLSRALRAASAELTDTLTKTTSVKHPGVRGTMREDAVRGVVRRLVPRQYEVASGVVVDATGAQSEEQDVILVDGSVAAPLIASERFNLHPMEAVTAVIQVKSRLDAKEVRSAVENVASAKRLVPDVERFGVVQGDDGRPHVASSRAAPFGAVFGFTHRGKRLADVYRTACLELPARERPNILVALDSFCIAWARPVEGGRPLVNMSAEGGDSLAIISGAEAPMMFFHLVLMNCLAEYIPPRLHLWSYMDATIPVQFSFWEPD